MVDTTGDIPDRDEVEPVPRSFVSDVLESGEITVTLANGETYELHEYDTHVYREHGTGRESYVYTKVGDDEVWFHTDDVVTVTRHY